MWPEGDVFGPSGAGPPEETQLLREIFFAALPRESHGQILPPRQRGPGLETLWALKATPPAGHAPPEAEEPEELEEEEVEEDEEEQTVQVAEKEFNFMDYLKR